MESFAPSLMAFYTNLRLSTTSLIQSITIGISTARLPSYGRSTSILHSLPQKACPSGFLHRNIMTPSRESSCDRAEESQPSLLDPDDLEGYRMSTRLPRSVSSASRFSEEPTPHPERTRKVSSVEGTSDQEHKRPLLRRKNIDQTTLSSVLAAFFVTVPFIAIVGILLYLINANRVGQEKLGLPDLHLPTDTSDSSAFLVDFSATQLTTLASWASNVATIVPGFLMTLYSWRVARYLLRQSEIGQSEKCPTPYQLGLLLEALDAKLMSVWNGFSYFFWKERLGSTKVLRLTIALLSAALALR